MFPSVEISELREEFCASPALCLGRSATVNLLDWKRITENALSSVAVEPSGTQADFAKLSFEERLDSIEARSPSAAVIIKEKITEQLRKVTSHPDLRHLVHAGWSACLSLSPDTAFESCLKDLLDSKASGLSATMVFSRNMGALPRRTIPIFKLLGNPLASNSSELSLAESEILSIQNTWPAMLTIAADYMKSGSLFCFGMDGSEKTFRPLLSLLLGLQRPGIHRLYFLKGDQILSDGTVAALCKRADTKIINGSLRDFCSAVEGLRGTRAVSRKSSNDSVEKLLEPVKSFATIVSGSSDDPAHLRTHNLQVVDALFRPLSDDFSPYQFAIDLQRTVKPQFLQSIRDCASDAPDGRRFVVARGEAGIGKTSLLKSCAVVLAQEGFTVLWCRRVAFGSWIRAFRELSRSIVALTHDERQKVRLIVFCDDPWGARIDPAELMGCFDLAQSNVSFVFAVRNSQYFATESGATSFGGAPFGDWEVPYELDDLELANLPSLLVSISAADTLETAKRIADSGVSRKTRDVLCSLWYLVPQTRFQLSESLRDEYFRLGEVSRPTQEIAAGIAESSEIARRAYEYVTVTASLGIGLPIEILVRALRIDYSDWLEACRDGRPVWGLLYDSQNEVDSTVTFWTRNEVVTEVLLELVNGGVGHSGEQRVLKELISACAVGSATYRDFVVDVLVRSRGKLESRLSYDQGIELFELAETTLPFADRVIGHHKGVWMHHHDRLTPAYQQLERALTLPLYPGADRDAPLEYIYTSMAAVLVQRIKEGSQDPHTGFEQIREHLKQASNPTFFNPHTDHVAAKFLFELSQMSAAGITPEMSMSSISESLLVIEHALQAIGDMKRSKFQHEKSVEMLLDLQSQILVALPDDNMLHDFSIQQFEKLGSQVGFELVARRMLVNATRANKGAAFNAVKEYLDEKDDLIESKGGSASADLLLVRADLIARWKIFREGGPVDWESYLDILRLVQSSTKHRDDPMRMLSTGVALYHLRKITEANAVFARIRSLRLQQMLPNEIRCYLKGGGGNPLRVQGVLERKHEKYFFFIHELDISILARRPPVESWIGTTVHGYVGFSLNGPIAVFDLH